MIWEVDKVQINQIVVIATIKVLKFGTPDILL